MSVSNLDSGRRRIEIPMKERVQVRKIIAGTEHPVAGEGISRAGLCRGSQQHGHENAC